MSLNVSDIELCKIVLCKIVLCIALIVRPLDTHASTFHPHASGPFNHLRLYPHRPPVSFEARAKATASDTRYPPNVLDDYNVRR